MKRLMFGLAAAIVALVGWAEKMPPLPEGAFTFAVIPDTQGYDGEGRTTKNGRKPGVGPTRNAQLDAIVGWLVAHKDSENIRFVTHTGDLTDMNNEPQWAFASKAMGRLDGVLPYAICPGNHDMKSSGDTTLFQKHFPASRYEGQPWYAGCFPGFVNKAGLSVSGNNANSCCLFECGGAKFVVLNLECNAPTPVLEWAGKLLEKYSDRHAIIATHQDLGAADRKNARVVIGQWGKLSKEERKTWSPDPKILGRLGWFKCHGKDGNSGLDIWKKLSSQHKNVFLVVSGDQGMIKLTRVDEKGVNGNMVHSLMQDTGGGFIRIFRFVPSEKAIRCYTINPREDGELVHEHGWWHEDKLFNFTLPWPGEAGTAEGTAETLGTSGTETKTLATGEFALVSPKEGETVALVPSAFKEFLLKDRKTRKRLFADKDERKKMSKTFPPNKPLGVTFAWTGTKGGELTVEKLPGREPFFRESVPSNTYTLKNFEIARDYAWQVKAADGKVLTGTFRTEDFAPRMIDWSGIPNVRDIGGRKGLGGKRVRQGMIYRSAGLNNNADWGFLKEEDLRKAHAEGKLEETIAATISSDGKPSDAKHYAKTIAKLIEKGEAIPKRYCDRKFLIPSSAKPGKERLNDATRKWGLEWLGIKTDLDLRCYREVWGMKGSPLGPTVKWYNYSSSNYDGLGTEGGRAAFTKCFRLFLDEANYPNDFHCIAGADRTGSLACILNGLLGVDEEELYRDWEVTGITNGSDQFNHKRLFDKLIQVFDKYEGATLNDRIEAYVLSCGFTKDDIAKFRKIMLEK